MTIEEAFKQLETTLTKEEMSKEERKVGIALLTVLRQVVEDIHAIAGRK